MIREMVLETLDELGLGETPDNVQALLTLVRDVLLYVDNTSALAVDKEKGSDGSP